MIAVEGDHVDASAAGVDPTAVRWPSPIWMSCVKRACVVLLGSGLRLDSMATTKAVLTTENRPEKTNTMSMSMNPASE